MSKEPNETPSEAGPFAAWRRILQQPEALAGPGPAGELTDKDAAWDKLFERLSGKPARRIIGYRIAAACLLIILIPAARLFQPHPHSVPGGGGVAMDKIRPAPAHPPVIHPTAREIRPRPVPGVRIKVTPARITTPSLAVAAPPVIPAATITISPPTPPPAQKPKKEWKVVDLNDIDPGHQRPHGMAANPHPQVLRLGIGPASAQTTEDQGRGDDARLKINLATQNR